MSELCELTGIKLLSGNNVSHSQRKTRRKFFPNLQLVSLVSDILGKRFKFKVAAKTLRTVEKYGGLDKYLLSANDELLSKSAQNAKAVIKEKSNRNN